MKVPMGIIRVVGKLCYNVDVSQMIAHKNHNSGSFSGLYRTPKGNYFHLWAKGEQSEITPLTLDGAARAYQEGFHEHDEPFDQVFPDVAVEDA